MQSSKLEQRLYTGKGGGGGGRLSRYMNNQNWKVLARVSKSCMVGVVMLLMEYKLFHVYF
jgi:hypothetical protein